LLKFILEDNYIVEYGLGLLVLNILVYLALMALIFGIFFIFQINLIQNLSALRLLNSHKFFSIIIILAFLSLAGVPPLLGFIGKFLLLMLIISTNNYLVFVFLSFINLFTLYFYLQNTRFIITKNQSQIQNVINMGINFSYKPINIVCLINSINFLGIFIFEDILIYVSTNTLYI
jgi:NADH:ubiquinone oxidoreductase subunit 2 (subunit N)